MAPKKLADKTEQRVVLSAVVLADSFTQRFRPITVERPKALLPLVNVPLLEYTLEWLALNHVDERDIIKNDFVLVNGDTVANLNLGPALAEHRARREQSKSSIMTMVMSRIKNPKQRLRLGDSDLIVAMDPGTKRLLKYVELEPSTAGAIKLDTGFFSERDMTEVRSDLMDTNICICAPEVLMLFSDNFDYQNVKRDFVSGVLSEEELGNKLYVYEVQGEYAARVQNLRSYDAISRDIMQRWVFPFVPDTNVLFKTGTWGLSKFSYSRGNRYLEQPSTVARTATIGGDVCIGAGTSIGDGSSICQSSIGRDCRIGRNVEVLGCYLGDGVTIHDNCKLRYVLVCDRAVVRMGASVGHGSILSYGVVIAPQHNVPPYSRISLCRQVQREVSLSDDELEYSGAGSPAGHGEDSGASNQPAAPSAAVVKAAEAIALGRAAPVDGSVLFDQDSVGAGGAGFLWSAHEGYNVERFSVAPPPEQREPELDLSTDEVVVEEGEKASQDEDGEAEDDDSEQDPEVAWKREVTETFLRCVKMGFKLDNVIIELNNLKIAEVRTFADVARYVFTTLLGLCLPSPRYLRSEYAELFPEEMADVTTQKGKLSLLTAFKVQLVKWKAILKQYLKDADDQVEMLLTLEEFCAMEGAFEGSDENGQQFSEIFANVLQMLYDEDVISEGAFLDWASEKEHAEEHERVFLRKAQAFIDWLREADEEDEDEDEDEDES